MDGTILDTFELHYETWQETFAGRDITFNQEIFRSHFGANNRETVPIYLGYEPDDSTYTQIANHKEELFVSNYPRKPGFSRALTIGSPILRITVPSKLLRPPLIWKILRK